MNNGIIAMIRDRGQFPGLLGRLVLYTFPVLGILGALALLALKQYQYLVLSIYILVPIIGAPLAYLAIRKKQESGSPSTTTCSSSWSPASSSASPSRSRCSTPSRSARRCTT